jgi:hypothetical protein
MVYTAFVKSLEYQGLFYKQFLSSKMLRMFSVWAAPKLLAEVMRKGQNLNAVRKMLLKKIF